MNTIFLEIYVIPELHHDHFVYEQLYKDQNFGCIMVAKVSLNQNNPCNTWKFHTTYSIKRKNKLLNTVQIVEFE